ncbi:MAG: response regulator transcription factor [Bacteroidota bacterium]
MKVASAIQTVFLIDDHPCVLEGITHLFEDDSHISLVGKATSGREGLRQCRAMKPHFLILDQHLPDINGLELARIMSQQQIPTQIILFTHNVTSEHLQVATSLGIRGVMEKSAPFAEIKNCIEALRQGKTYTFISQGASTDAPSTIRHTPGQLPSLTRQEKRIMQLISHGKSTKEIGETLHVSRFTIEKHRSNICKKLGISGKNTLLVYALKNKQLFG